jgi:hypothetical protein
MRNNSIAPDFIKVAAVVVALPRWVLALLAADGYAVPASWAWVHAVSAVFGSAMCVLEGIAIAYILGALVRAQGKQIVILGTLTLATCATFAGVLTPSIYSRVTGAEIRAVLPAWGTWIWAACVALSTIATVGAVGYAQAVAEGDAAWRMVAGQWHAEAERLRADLAEQDAQMRQVAAQVAQPTPYACASCERTFASQQALAAHIRHAHKNGHTVTEPMSVAVNDLA